MIIEVHETLYLQQLVITLLGIHMIILPLLLVEVSIREIILLLHWIILMFPLTLLNLHLVILVVVFPILTPPNLVLTILQHTDMSLKHILKPKQTLTVPHDLKRKKIHIIPIMEEHHIKMLLRLDRIIMIHDRLQVLNQHIQVVTLRRAQVMVEVVMEEPPQAILVPLLTPTITVNKVPFVGNSYESSPSTQNSCAFWFDPSFLMGNS